MTDREQYIDELHGKMQRMEDSHTQQLGEMQQKHQSEVVDLKSKHSTEVTLLNDIIRKSQALVPDVGGILANGKFVFARG